MFLHDIIDYMTNFKLNSVSVLNNILCVKACFVVIYIKIFGSTSDNLSKPLADGQSSSSITMNGFIESLTSFDRSIALWYRYRYQPSVKGFLEIFTNKTSISSTSYGSGISGMPIVDIMLTLSASFSKFFVVTNQ